MKRVVSIVLLLLLLPALPAASPAPGADKCITTIGPSLEIPARSTVTVGAMISTSEEV